MSQTLATADTPRTFVDDPHISDVMLYDIARDTASVLSSRLLRLIDAAPDDATRKHWEARRRLVKQQVKALDPDDRAVIFAQDELWEMQRQALPKVK